MQVAKAVLKEAVSGSKFAVEAVEQSDVAHITFQKVSLQANRSNFVSTQIWSQHAIAFECHLGVISHAVGFTSVDCLPYGV